MPLVQLHRWANMIVSNSRVWSVDGYQLALAMTRIQHGDNSSVSYNVRNVLVSQARDNHNTVAVSLVKINHHFGLMQYHGMLGYLQQTPLVRKWSAKHLTSTPGRTGGTNSFSNSNHNPHSPKDKNNKETNVKVAKVAFMITAAQKEELKVRLGYDTSKIKKLTPLQAMLILQHNITSGRLDEESTLLETLAEQHSTDRKNDNIAVAEQSQDDSTPTIMEYSPSSSTNSLFSSSSTSEQQPEKQEEEPVRMLLDSHSHTVDSDPHTNNGEASLVLDRTTNDKLVGTRRTGTEDDPVHKSTTDCNEDAGASSHCSPSSRECVIGTNENENDTVTNEKYGTEQAWYEVIETHPERGSSVVALYSTRKEAQFCLDIKKEFVATRKSKGEGSEEVLEGQTRYAIRLKGKQ